MLGKYFKYFYGIRWNGRKVVDIGFVFLWSYDMFALNMLIHTVVNFFSVWISWISFLWKWKSGNVLWNVWIRLQLYADGFVCTIFYYQSEMVKKRKIVIHNCDSRLSIEEELHLLLLLLDLNACLVFPLFPVLHPDFLIFFNVGSSLHLCN